MVPRRITSAARITGRLEVPCPFSPATCLLDSEQNWIRGGLAVTFLWTSLFHQTMVATYDNIATNLTKLIRRNSYNLYTKRQ